ncbi:unnamed protein product [Leptidea sinapis]|uniref:Uncharacterized protein n=1 Tax=Leptidea sinapis TaxID=189913 RepID=A0A5E4QR94_9NEOP|nr:unnamed protein product [Leptidea sinapis]
MVVGRSRYVVEERLGMHPQIVHDHHMPLQQARATLSHAPPTHNKILRENETAPQPVDRGPSCTDRGPPCTDRDRDRVSDRGREDPVTSIKLGDLASNIIVRDFSSPNTTSLLHHNNRYSVSSAESYQTCSVSGSGVAAAAGGGADDEWRRDRDKHASYFEPSE